MVYLNKDLTALRRNEKKTSQRADENVKKSSSDLSDLVYTAESCTAIPIWWTERMWPMCILTSWARAPTKYSMQSFI